MLAKILKSEKVKNTSEKQSVVKYKRLLYRMGEIGLKPGPRCFSLNEERKDGVETEALFGGTLSMDSTGMGFFVEDQQFS